MNDMKKLLVAIIAFTAFSASAQYRYRDSNRIGISVGMNQFTLNTSDFQTKPGSGWNGGLSVRGNFFNDFDMVFGLQFSENNFSVETTSPILSTKEVDYKLASAQIMLLLSYKIVESHLSVEFGPMLQVNGKLTLDEADEINSINGTTLLAKDITGISQFNFYPTVGITAGVKHVRANIIYQYGVNNILGGLNDEGLGQNFKGHAGILTGSIIFYL